MPEEPQVQVFVKVAKDGTVERTHHFAPWPAQDQRGGVATVIDFGALPHDGEHRPLRHLTWDDPPGVGTTPGEYRALLAEKALAAGSLERFVGAVTRVLVHDMVISHGCHPEDAIPAAMEFATKAYFELTGPV